MMILQVVLRMSSPGGKALDEDTNTRHLRFGVDTGHIQEGPNPCDIIGITKQVM